MVISLVDFSLSRQVRTDCSEIPVSADSCFLPTTTCPCFTTIFFHSPSLLFAENNKWENRWNIFGVLYHRQDLNFLKNFSHPFSICHASNKKPPGRENHIRKRDRPVVVSGARRLSFNKEYLLVFMCHALMQIYNYFLKKLPVIKNNEKGLYPSGLAEKWKNAPGAITLYHFAYKTHWVCKKVCFLGKRVSSGPWTCRHCLSLLFPIGVCMPAL